MQNVYWNNRLNVKSIHINKIHQYDINVYLFLENGPFIPCYQSETVILFYHVIGVLYGYWYCILFMKNTVYWRETRKSPKVQWPNFIKCFKVIYLNIMRGLQSMGGYCRIFTINSLYYSLIIMAKSECIYYLHRLILNSYYWLYYLL